MMSEQSPEKPGEQFNVLRRISAEIGSDPLLVQGAGGNTSIKQDDVMWIKASGTLLADALEKDIFVPVNLPAMRAAVENNHETADQPKEFLIPGTSSLRPSIETSLHSAFPHRVVLHAHCVHTLAHAIRADREKILSQKLKGMDWALVPYAKPGADLAASVAAELKGNVNIVVLGNHGIIVGGDTVEEAHATLRTVHEKLHSDPALESLAALNTLEDLARDGDYALPDDPGIHQLALNSIRVNQAKGGSLYPDHVIFCGIAATVLTPGESPADAAQRVTATGAPPPPFLIVPELGVLVRNDASAGALALLRCLLDVLMRVPTDAELIYLSQEQNLELLDWDAEKYRKTLNAD